MTTILIILGVLLIIGLLTREKGDGFLDTIGKGCSLVIGVIVIIVVILLITN